MTKQEFLQARAKADYLKRNGVTKCAPSPIVQRLPARRQAKAHRRDKFILAAVRMSNHPVEDESGEARPIRWSAARNRF